MIVITKDRKKKYPILCAASLLLDVVYTQQFDIMQLDKCLQDLVSSDTTTFQNSTGTTNNNSSDGYISLYEYESFINERYYNNCSNNVIVTESIVQWEAFTLLACHSCLMDVLFIDTIPDCCLPFNTSQININLLLPMVPDVNVQAYNATQFNWIEKICSTVDAAAVLDKCYTVPPTTSPIIDFSTDNDDSHNSATSDDNIDICIQELIYIDNNVSLMSNNTVAGSTNATIIDGKEGQNVGLISKQEFHSVLQQLSIYITNSSLEQQTQATQCTVTANRYIIDAAYINLACASCTTSYVTTNVAMSRTSNNNTTSLQLPDLSCCTNPNTSISIYNDIVAYNGTISNADSFPNSNDENNTRSSSTTIVITPLMRRICTTMYSLLDCNADNDDERRPTFSPTIAPIMKSHNIVNITVPSVIIPPPTVAPLAMSPSVNVSDTTNNNTNTTTITMAPGQPPAMEPSNSIDLQPSSSVQLSPSRQYSTLLFLLIFWCNW